MAQRAPGREPRRDDPPRHSSWGIALGRALRALAPRRRGDRRRGWSLIVPVVLFLAGLLLVTSAETARGTDLRTDRRVELRELIGQRKGEVNAAEKRAQALREEVDDATRAEARSDTRTSEQQRRADANSSGAGLTAVRGAGLTVRLDDAPRRADGGLPPGATPDDLVVHQQDVQAVVNAMWAGGAEAMSIMGVRVISTSAVRCVGNTLLLGGRVYSPPFVITAIGDPRRMRAALDAAPAVRAYRTAVRDFGLGYAVTVHNDVRVPAYQGPGGLTHARPTR